MAHAGSGGWIPSSEVILRNGSIQLIGITQNAPRDIVHTDHSDPGCAGDLLIAYIKLLAGKTVRVDVRVPNLATLHQLHAGLQAHPQSCVLGGLARTDINQHTLAAAWRHYTKENP